MQLELKGKAALVTGASRGIGRAIAGVLHAEGCRLAINGRNPEPLAAGDKIRLPRAIEFADEGVEFL